MGWEENELKPYKEPAKDILDTKRIGKNIRVGHTMQCIVSAVVLVQQPSESSNIVIFWCL